MATPHVEDELAMLLQGELDRDQTNNVARHLQGCSSCTDALIDATVANAALRSASRAERFDLEWEALEPDAATDPLPPLELDRRPAGTRARRRVVGAAAAVILLLGAGTAAWLGTRSTSPVVATATLHPLGSSRGGATGSVTVTADAEFRQMTVTSTGLAAPARNHFYEVWLLQPTTNKMLAVGELSPTTSSHFVVSSSLMAGYSAVDVSLQANNGDPAHSTVSVLRGYL